MHDYYWMLIGNDEFELPIAVSDSRDELAKMLKIKPQSITKSIWDSKNKCQNTHYIKIRKDEDMSIPNDGIRTKDCHMVNRTTCISKRRMNRFRDNIQIGDIITVEKDVEEFRNKNYVFKHKKVKATVLEKYPFIVVTDQGDFSWISVMMGEGIISKITTDGTTVYIDGYPTRLIRENFGQYDEEQEVI